MTFSTACSDCGREAGALAVGICLYCATSDRCARCGNNTRCVLVTIGDDLAELWCGPCVALEFFRLIQQSGTLYTACQAVAARTTIHSDSELRVIPADVVALVRAAVRA